MHPLPVPFPLHLCWPLSQSSFQVSSLKPFLKPSIGIGIELSLLPWICRTLDRSPMALLCSLGLESIVDKSFLPLEITNLHFGSASPLHTVGTQWMDAESIAWEDLHPSSSLTF